MNVPIHSFRLLGGFLLGLTLGSPSLSAVEAEELICRQASGRELNLAAANLPAEPAGRHYAPDRKVDITRLVLDVTPDFAQSGVAGIVTLEFTPVGKPLDELRLDALDLTVGSLESNPPVSAHHNTGEELVLTWDNPVPVGRKTSLKIRYHAFPTKGLYFRTPAEGYEQADMHVWTQGEMTEARHWFPCFDFPNEKMATEMICRVPQDMTVLSNGSKVGETVDEATGLKAVHWRQDQPHVNYLITLVAGYFKTVSDTYLNIPLTFHTPPSDIGEAPNSFEETKAIMSFLEKEIGMPYPWAKYGQVVVHDFHWGGMENTSLTTLTDRTLFTKASENIRSSRGLVTHELAHQWFGDLVTCKDWSHTWLNEGFATYYTHLYHGHAEGSDAMKLGLYEDRARIAREKNDTIPIVWRGYQDPKEQFSFRAYAKGSWVLHMLRTDLGPDLYRECVLAYLKRHRFDTVVTEDLNQVIEELSGRSFDEFFDQWVYHPHHPELTVTHAWDAGRKQLKVTVKQTQKTSDGVPVFRFPLQVRVGSGKDVTEHTLRVSAKEEDFWFALPAGPDWIRVDPEVSLLAKITFKPPTAMLHRQLKLEGDALGRLEAAEALAAKNDPETLKRLDEALNTDAFYAVRVAAAEALRKIHSDEALTLLARSRKQEDPRVRMAVVEALGGFYHPAARGALLKVAEEEANPEILAAGFKALGTYDVNAVRTVLIEALGRDSYRNKVGDAALAGMKRMDRPAFITPVLEHLQGNAARFTTRGWDAALETLAFLARNQRNRDAVRRFLADQLTHKKEAVRVAAIDALGTLEDPQALALLETFAGLEEGRREKVAADKAIAALRDEKTPTAELGTLRKEILDLKKDRDKLTKDLETLKKQVEAGNKK